MREPLIIKDDLREQLDSLLATSPQRTPREIKTPAFSPDVELVTLQATLMGGVGSQTQGRGGAAAYFAYCQSQIEWVVGMPIFPGTMNVHLDGNFHLIDPWQSVNPQDFLTTKQQARSVTCTVNGVFGLILRTCPLDRNRTEFEIVCHAEVPNLKGNYGSAVTLVFENEPA